MAAAHHHHPPSSSDATSTHCLDQTSPSSNTAPLVSVDAATSPTGLETLDEETIIGDIGLMLPPSDDDVLGQDSLAAAAHIYAPPPHIADRCYRPSTARRRESAASSRRNSISSAHSRCSSSQLAAAVGLSGPQSKIVAQHLRRASFLADRQARLADRAAHAEKVRVRAALAKSSTQARDASVSAERALAAQQARERNLAEIASTCAEEYKKAKAIAESMKEKRELELANLRAQIEERHAEAEKRREELRTRSTTRKLRAHSVTASRKRAGSSDSAGDRPPSAKTREAAAERIQWWWRAMARKQAITDFSELGLVVDSVRDTSFEKVTQLLQQEPVMQKAARVLRICGLREGEPGSIEEMAAARVFLSAFLILGHPKSVFNRQEPNKQMEQELVAKARDQLICFENIFSRLTASNSYTMPPSQRKLLPEAYAMFHNLFISWKSRDQETIIETMLMQFVELEAIWRKVKDSTEDTVAQTYKESIKQNQVLIIVRMKRLVGQQRAMKLISDAVKRSRRAAKKPKGDTRPRVVEGAASSDAPAGSTTLSVPQAGSSPTAAPERSAFVPTKLSGLLPDNRIIVHELAIDREYVIPTEEFKEAQAMNQAALILQMRITAGQSQEETFFEMFKLLAQGIKEKLQRLVRQGSAMYKLIDDLLDLEVAERQFRVGSFSYDKYFASVTSILPQLCAPFRDEELKNLVEKKLQQGDLVDRAEALMGFVDATLCDYVNHLLQSAAPSLIESATPYEVKQFGEYVRQKGNGALASAEAAWRAARSKIMAEVTKRDPEGINHPKSRPSGDKIYYQMLVDVFTQPGPITADKVPEMLHLDIKRIARISTMTQRIVTAGAILVQCKNLLKRDVRTPWRTEASRIITVLENDKNPESMLTGIMAALESGRSMPAVTKTQLRALVGKVLAAVSSSADSEPREPVLRLLLNRLRGNVLARVSASGSSGSATDKVRETSSAGEKLARIGLGEFVDSVRDVADEVGRVARVDRAAHAEWWEAVATKIAGEDSQA